MGIGNQGIWDKGIGDPATQMLMQSSGQAAPSSGRNFGMALSGSNDPVQQPQTSGAVESDPVTGQFSTGERLTFQPGSQLGNKNYAGNISELQRRIAEAEASGDAQLVQKLKYQLDFYMRGIASPNAGLSGGTLPGQ